ncbi:glutamate racemase [Pseudoalteromonas tunicata]|uniref:Glutamate racemase n=1 Tax=Pseudoalteromonas tunicata D2 TaxID=87626 RepID=A4CFR3_9GAMM|nr:glutamate racemase [Pseudoalteromonas tunicata D2]
MISLQPHIVVFDSGIGGTTVLEHIQAAYPFAQYSYLMDNLFMPYGNLTIEVLQQRLLAKLKTVQEQFVKIDIIVIACNTASTQTLDFLRSYTDIPIVGVVPAIKPACLQSSTGSVGLLATPGTIKNVYTQSLINAHSNNVKVHLYGSTRLVSLAEDKFWFGVVSIDDVAEELERLKIEQSIDHLILGCTHFPFLKSELAQLLSPSMKIIDSGAAIANRVSFLLSENGWVKDDAQNEVIKKPLRYYATAPTLSNKITVEQIKLIDPQFHH